MPVSVGAYRESLFARLRVIPAITHYGHKHGMPCGLCDAAPGERPRTGVYPEARAAQRGEVWYQ